MKSFILAISTSLFLISCKKNVDNNNNCKLAQKNDYSSGTISSSYLYEYDDMNRVKKITNTYNSTSIVTNFTYSPDSVVALSNNRHTYFLNNNGLADSSALIVPGSPEQIKLYYKYTYNSAGYLVSERQIFSQVYNGNIILDTTIISYTIANGNLVKITDSQSTDETTFEYSNQLRPDNNFELTAQPNKFSFLGTSSKNLLSKVLIGSSISAEVSYEKDKKGNIIKQTNRNSTNGQIAIIEYLYLCN